MRLTTEKDDERHLPENDNPAWSESWVFNGYDPENDIFVHMRLGLEPNRKMCNVAVYVAIEGKEVYGRTRRTLLLPDGTVTDGIEVDGLRFSSSQLAKDYSFSFADPDFSLAFAMDWRALMPAVDPIAKDQAPNAAASMHIEQAGRVSGEVSFRERKWKFNGLGNRDHATGTRDWSKISRHSLAWPVFTDGTAMSIVRGYDGLSDKPFDLMWYYDGRAVRSLKFISYNAVINEEDKPLAARFVAEGEDGTRYELTCTRKAVCHWSWDGYLLNECAFEFRLPDGRVGYRLMETGMKLGVYSRLDLSYLT